jgi:hypothetical protein
MLYLQTEGKVLQAHPMCGKSHNTETLTSGTGYNHLFLLFFHQHVIPDGIKILAWK